MLAGILLGENGALLAIVAQRAQFELGEFDGFPGLRLGGENNQTNVATERVFQAFSTYPTFKRSRRRRTEPSDSSLNQQTVPKCHTRAEL